MRKLLFIILLCGISLSLSAISPKDMPNVQIADGRQFISDPAGLLSQSVKAEVNARLLNLRRSTSCEFAVAIPPSLDGESVEEWSSKLFNLWGIGKSDKDNGVLLVISPESRECRIEVGYGMEGVLTDIACAEIVRSKIVPNMKIGDISAAVNESTALICDAIENPEVAEELRSAEPDNYQGTVKPISAEVLWNFFYIVVGIFFVASLTLAIGASIKTTKCKGLYAKAECWRHYLKAFLLLGIGSAGVGLVFWLLAYFMYRYYRMRPRKCPECGHYMHRLPEDKDNELLNDAQDFEERIRTVDYDVWECDKCGSVERFPYKANQKKYTECPRCHTIAMSLQGDVTVTPPTTKSEGIGEKIYHCEYCGNTNRRRYSIAKKEDPTAALAAGAILGAAAGRGRGGGSGFGGGGFGGGFGGGMSGGGGASGRW